MRQLTVAGAVEYKLFSHACARLAGAVSGERTVCGAVGYISLHTGDFGSLVSWFIAVCAFVCWSSS